MKVSVIVLCYNSEKTVGRALDSLMRQHCDFDWEIVVGDDGSTDGTREVVRTYASQAPAGRFRLLFSEENRGVQANYYDCLEAASGEYIADCAADDAWQGSDRLQAFVDALDSHPEASWAFSDWTEVDLGGKDSCARRPAIARDVAPGDMLLPVLAARAVPAVHLSAAVFRKQALMPEYLEHRDDLFRNKDFGCEDFQVVATLAACGSGIYIPRSTLFYSVGGESITSVKSPSRAARFAMSTLKLRAILARNYGMITNRQVASALSEKYHFALSQAILSDDKLLIDEVVNTGKLLPEKQLRTLLLQLVLRLPGGHSFVRFFKNIKAR